MFFFILPAEQSMLNIIPHCFLLPVALFFSVVFHANEFELEFYSLVCARSLKSSAIMIRFWDIVHRRIHG